MTDAAIPSSAFTLLAGLEANNNKGWFDAHRARIRDEVQEPFAGVLDAVTEALARSALPLIGGRHTMFRMNRDVRFSADKRPYNAHVSGVLTQSGRKDEGGGVLYLHLMPTGGFVAAGHYKLPPAALAPIRDRIVADPDRFRAILDRLADAGLELSRDMTLKAMPQGYAAHAGAWFADYLKLQAFMTRTDVGPETWTSGRIVGRAAAIATGSAALFGLAEPRG